MQLINLDINISYTLKLTIPEFNNPHLIHPKKFCSIVLLLLGFLLFNSFKLHSQSNDTLRYIFLGHIKEKRNGLDRVDQRLEQLDLSVYDRIWLGGDVTDESNSRYSTLKYIDSLFDVSNPLNHWAFGNHDLRNFNVEWLEEITNKPTYYHHSSNGIVTIVLNYSYTPSDCENLNKQFDLIKNVCDTISQSSHLIILSHYCPWNGAPGIPLPSAYAHSDIKAWIANCNDKPATFVDVIYPLLVNVKNKGVEVINILGDTGSSNKGQSMISSDGIYFIASGINKKSQDRSGPDKVLIFKHHVPTRSLEWDFHILDSL